MIKFVRKDNKIVYQTHTTEELKTSWLGDTEFVRFRHRSHVSVFVRKGFRMANEAEIMRCIMKVRMWEIS
jgi:hypothetical protein